MSKICPKCRREQKDPSHLGCEKCKVPFVDATELVTSFTRDELKVIAGFLLKDWRVYVVAGIFLLVGVVLLYWQAREHIKTQIEQFQVTVSNQVVTAYSTATNQLAHQFQVFAGDASNEIAEAYSSVTNQIAEEFQTPRIKQTIENVARGEAKSILEAEVQPAVTSFKEDALFMRTIARAQGYDFKAYQALLEIADGTNENAQLANQVLNELDRSLSRDRSAFSGKKTLMTYAGTNFYNGPFTSDELAPEFKDASKDRTSFNREGFVNTASELKQPLFMSLFIAFFTNETDLGVADRLTIAISDLAKQDFHPRDFKRIQTWWTLHQTEYTNWPVSEFNEGRIKFATARHKEAFDSFQKVLALDPSADQSRAFAIASSLRTGNTNSAAELLKGFKQTDARWAQWATALIELETGNASNATVRFADLRKKQPSMIPLPTQEVNGWSKIDWPLFNKHISSDKP
jgi:tetratricopeptide (TPR) repeat protein